MQPKNVTQYADYHLEEMPYRPRPSRGHIRRAAQLTEGKVDWLRIDAATRRPRFNVNGFNPATGQEI
jgi:hypothetical protein